MANRHELESFIGTSFRSVWALELLIYLADNPDRSFTPEDLITALRASEAVASQSVGNLVAVGLAVTDADGRVTYHAGPGQQSELVSSAIALYRRSPDKVRRLIVAQSVPGLTAFADAFRLRKD